MLQPTKKLHWTMTTAISLLVLFVQLSGVFSRPLESANATKSAAGRLLTASATKHKRSAMRRFEPPLLKHRLQSRSSRFFRENDPEKIMSPGSFSSPIAKMIIQKEGGSRNSEEIPEQDPTFTPYISARVFNLPQFLDHVRNNLESINDGDFGSEEFDYEDFQNINEDEPKLLPEFNIPEKLRWTPAAFGRPRMMHIRHFIQQPGAGGRNAYEFGLG